jgi:hypothetical protein
MLDGNITLEPTVVDEAQGEKDEASKKTSPFPSH